MIRKYLPFLISFLLFLIISFLFYDNIFSTRFVDEEFNFIVGKYLTRGEILYDDIIANHQPLTLTLSSFIQEIAQPNTIYPLISMHRLFILLWAFLWSLILVSYFRWRVLIFISIFELTKFYLFGHLFLAESLLVYPLAIIIGLTLFKEKYTVVDSALYGVTLAITTFLWGPIWPCLGVLTLIFIYKNKKHPKSFLLTVLGFLIASAIILSKTSFLGYLHYYIYTNLIYTVPNYHAIYYNEPWGLTFLKSFSSPILAFFNSNLTPTLWIIRISLILLAINLFFEIKQRKYSKALIIFVVLGLSNIRFVYPGNEYYAAGFLAWYSSLIFITALSIKKFNLLNSVLIIFLIALSVNFSYPFVLKQNSALQDLEINFSTPTSDGELIRNMKNEKDTLFVSNDSWLTYWQSDAYHMPKLFGYYTWMSGIPKLHNAVLENFEKNPPTFFYCDNCKSNDLGKYLDKYTQIKKEGSLTNIYLLKK